MTRNGTGFRGRLRAVALGGLAGVALSACAGAPPPPPDGRSGATLTPAAAARPVPARKAVTPGEVENRPAPVVRTLLGPPDLERREPPAEVWQYVTGGCILDITFYPATEGQTPRAAYLESRDIDGAPMAPADCLPHVGVVAP